MYSKPYGAKLHLQTKWMIKQYEGKKEDRQHEHVNKLWHKSPEKSWNLSHF
jgi:hypothetical protein